LGRLDDARNVLTQTPDKTRQLDMPLEQTQVLIALGELEVQAGHPRMAAQYFEEAGSLSRKDGFIHSIAWSMYEAARVYRDEGRYADAERCESEAMIAMHEVADEYHLPLHLTMLADLKAKEGDPEKAQELYEQATDVVDTLLANSPSEQLKSSLISTVSETYGFESMVTNGCRIVCSGFPGVGLLGEPEMVSLYRFRGTQSAPVSVYELVPDDDLPAQARREALTIFIFPLGLGGETSDE
jgi:tetratricopeptide (TPR) repeat protein